MRLAYATFAVLAVLLVAGCGKKEAPDCGTYMDHKLRSECMYNQSVTLRNPSMCKDIPDLDVKTKCINEVSVMLGNEAYCMYHERLSVKEGCERKVAEAMTAKKRNQSAGT